MIVQLTATTAEVVEADDLTRLHVASGLDSAELAEALRITDTGSLQDDGNVLLSVEVLRARARSAASLPDWDDRWQKMIDYADRSGWVSPEGDTVRAHVEAPR